MKKSFLYKFLTSIEPRRADITQAKRVKCLRAGLGPKKLWQVGPHNGGLYRETKFIKKLAIEKLTLNFVAGSPAFSGPEYRGFPDHSYAVAKAMAHRPARRPPLYDCCAITRGERGAKRRGIISDTTVQCML